MQLLEACGVSAVSDGVRSEDEHNAKGYFEHEKVRQWELDAGWLDAQRGKAIKIVEPLLRQAPLPKGRKWWFACTETSMLSFKVSGE
jgi:hypothetical protein